MTRRALLVVLLVALVASACSGSGERASGESVPPATTRESPTTTGAKAQVLPPLTDVERRWIRRYSRWTAEMWVPIQSAVNIRVRWRFILFDPKYTGRPVAKYRRNLPRVRACERRLERELGAPPGDRLAKAYERLVRGCDLFVKAAESDTQAVAAQDIDAFDTSEDTWDEAVLAFERADEVVVALLRHRQPLPTKRGRTDVSRIEPVFGDVASRLTVENHEVRCWSDRDWPIVIEDRLAYEGGPIDVNLLGFAGTGQPLHLAPEVCDALARFRYEGWRPAGGDGLLHVAEAVDVLMHEAEHGVGVWQEAVAECHAAQRIREAARLLGARKGYADLLAETYWADMYPYLPRAYVTDDCQDGGPLDLHPQTSRWP